MDLPIRFWASGTPVPQGSKSIWQGRVMDSKKTELDRWRRRVRTVAVMARDKHGLTAPMDGPLKVWAAFYVERPKRPRWPFPATVGTGDVDKLTRALLDALSETRDDRGLIQDDARVVQLSISKHYALDPADYGVSVAVSYAR